RRHTRFSRDWSSDVCSSDLPFAHGIGKAGLPQRHAAFAVMVVLVVATVSEVLHQLRGRVADVHRHLLGAVLAHVGLRLAPGLVRSEERRVGKESRGWLCGY